MNYLEKDVLHIIGSGGIGGIQSVAKGIISKSQCSLFSLQKNGIEIYNEVSENVFFGTKSQFYICNPFVFFKIIHLVEKRKIKILHTHTIASLLYAICIKFFYSDLKVIYHEHNKIFTKKILGFFLKIFKRKIDLFIAVSKTTKIQLIKKANIDSKKIVVLYNFVDLEKFDKNVVCCLEKKQKLKIRKGEFVIGFVGRLAEIKGCEYLIRALPYLDFDYKVLIVGDGSLRKELEELTKKLNIQNRVVFLGYQKKIEKFYLLFNILIAPSLNEGSPMILYEAQAFGIPIIGSNVPGINEFIIPSKNGLLFEVKNSKDLAQKIDLLYKDQSLRLKMNEYAIENIKKHSLENYLQKLKFFYLELE